MSAPMIRRACVGGVVAVLLANLSSASVAAERRFGPFVVESDQPSVIRLEGEIGPLELFNFSDAKKATTEPRTLVLDSRGGSIIVALTIAETMAEEGFATVVPEDAECLSACAFLFFAGESRELRGKLGVHQVASTKSGDVSFTQTVLARVSRFFQQTKTSPGVFTVMLTTPPDQMHIFGDVEIERLAINRATSQALSEEEMDTIRLCDELAGHPADPDRNLKFAGVAYEDIQVVSAIKSCEAAVAAKPSEMRLSYQFGRALQRSERFNEAVKWYRKAAAQGYPAAQFTLGLIYSHGKNVSRDWLEAVSWYRKAADQGHTAAQDSLGHMYHMGKGVSKNAIEAVKWYRKAADHGNASAQTSLGFMYYRGEGVSRDLIEAVKWYRKAADQGYATAQYSLGWLYENGEGVSKDQADAVKWYRKAAEQGNENAQNALQRLSKS
ncbi:hypothetical protein [Jiella marina]|uniref:hypothetical protein n=1 Tax=Jiella sp. LLJ827 TaxID=2917712 RepID=UPI002100D510|nr:hypothetical protein [Jiella sp. LLJ827]